MGGGGIAFSYQCSDLDRLDRLFLFEVGHLRDRLSRDANRIFALFVSVWQSAQTGTGCEKGGGVF